MKHYRTTDLIQAVLELARKFDTQYAEDCLKAVLASKLVTVDQFFIIMQHLYP